MAKRPIQKQILRKQTITKHQKAVAGIMTAIREMCWGIFLGPTNPVHRATAHPIVHQILPVPVLPAPVPPTQAHQAEVQKQEPENFNCRMNCN